MDLEEAQKQYDTWKGVNKYLAKEAHTVLNSEVKEEAKVKPKKTKRRKKK